MTRPDDMVYPDPSKLSDGLSKRELFAAMVLQGLSASSLYVGDWDLLAKSAVGRADALISALNKTT